MITAKVLLVNLQTRGFVRFIQFLYTFGVLQRLNGRIAGIVNTKTLQRTVQILYSAEFCHCLKSHDFFCLETSIK